MSKTGQLPSSFKPASSGRKSTISVCMMVKNEEKRLPVALASVKDWVDEIIVVDTGSTDRTIEIAESFGARIYHHPWEHDFAKHRNQTIQYANGDWILILDADEEVAEESRPTLPLLAQAPPEVHCIMFRLYNSMAGGQDTFLMHPRMFRNRVGFHYEGKVHNRPIITGKVYSSDVKLYHYGYNEDKETMEIKHQRRITMIRKWVEEEPENFHARSYLAHTLQARPETSSEAIEQALTGLELLKNAPEDMQPRFAPHLYYPLFNCLMSHNRFDELFQHGQNCIDMNPTYPDTYYFTTQVYFRQQEWEKAFAAGMTFLEMQEYSDQHPENFIYYENLSRSQINYTRMRIVIAAAYLHKDEDAIKVYEQILDNGEAMETNAKLTVQNLLGAGFAELARLLTEKASQVHPEWPWPENLLQLVQIKAKEQQAGKIKEQAQELLKEEKFSQALPLFAEAEKSMPLDDQVLLGLGRCQLALGNLEQAASWLVAGLNLHPGHPWAWLELADYYFDQQQYASAAACYQRFLQMSRSSEQVAERLSSSLQHAKQQPTVRQKPPRLVVFLVNSLSYELVKEPAPHFLMGKAWGEFLYSGFEDQQDSLWVSLMTGARPLAHGITRDSSWQNPIKLSDIKMRTIWELLPKGTSLGLAAVPFAFAPSELEAVKNGGWCLPGFPAGVLKPHKIEPAGLAGLALAHGYRSDYLLSEYAEQLLPSSINGNIVQEAFMLQQERNKIITAMNMPAVDVLVIGFNFIEYQQRVHGLAQYNTFSVYEQLYGWIDTMLAALGAENFAIFSQRGATITPGLYQGGFYAMSWLKGENGQAEITDVATPLLQLLGGNPEALGQPR